MPDIDAPYKKFHVKRRSPKEIGKIYHVMDYWSSDEIITYYKTLKNEGEWAWIGVSGSESSPGVYKNSEYGFKNCSIDGKKHNVEILSRLEKDVTDWTKRTLDLNLVSCNTIVNWFRYGDYSTAHFDSRNALYTAIVYLNPKWHYNDGSGTMIFEDDPKYLAYYAFPTPASFVLFPSSMFHKAVPPEKMAKEGRMSATFQLKLRE